jgi:hypothetical protein
VLDLSGVAAADPAARACGTDLVKSYRVINSRLGPSRGPRGNSVEPGLEPRLERKDAGLTLLFPVRAIRLLASLLRKCRAGNRSSI